MLQAIVIGLIVGLSISWFSKSMENNIARKKTKVQPKHAKLSKDDEELITAILPVINKK